MSVLVKAFVGDVLSDKSAVESQESESNFISIVGDLDEKEEIRITSHYI